MNGEHLLPVGEGKVDNGMDDLHTGVGNQHVHSAPLLHDCGDACVHLLFAGHIHADAKRFNLVFGRNFGSSGIGAVKIEIGNGDVCAVRRELLCNSPSYAGGGAGDDADFVFHFHGSFL